MSRLLHLALSLAAAALSVQGADQPRFTPGPALVGGPGGPAQGGRFHLEGAVLPLPAGALDSSRFRLVAGFLAPVTVQQVAGAPRLAITLLPDGRIQLDWDAAAGEFVLHGTTDPVAGPWQPVEQTVATAGTGRRVLLPAAAALRCYRLQPGG